MGRGGTRRNGKVRGWLLVFVNTRSTACPCVSCWRPRRRAAPPSFPFDPIAPTGTCEVVFFFCFQWRTRSGGDGFLASSVTVKACGYYRHEIILSLRIKVARVGCCSTYKSQISDQSVCHTSQQLPAAKTRLEAKNKKKIIAESLISCQGLQIFPQMKRNMAVH